MKLKLDEHGHVVVQDGKPVYTKDDGTDVAFDVTGTTQTISRLNAEAKQHRERAEMAEGKLKGFEGIADPDAARKALETMQSLDQKKLIEVGEVEKVKSEISKAFQAQLEEASSKASKLEQQLYAEMIGGSFARSKFVAEKMAIPPDLVQAAFGNAFAIEEGRIVAKDRNGSKLYSPSNPGELASFDEALDMLVSQYPGKDHILKGNGSSGSGANGSQGGGGQPQGNMGGTREQRLAAIKQKTSGA